MKQEVIIYASQETENTPIYINFLGKDRGFEKVEVTPRQAMKLVIDLLPMIQPHVVNPLDKD
tara:strand:+ start:672 stop:857 length:186 start_codon:yes stop_codon:yes gene_type:complete